MIGADHDVRDRLVGDVADSGDQFPCRVGVALAIGHQDSFVGHDKHGVCRVSVVGSAGQRLIRVDVVRDFLDSGEVVLTETAFEGVGRANGVLRRTPILHRQDKSDYRNKNQNSVHFKKSPDNLRVMPFQHMYGSRLKRVRARRD